MKKLTLLLFSLMLLGWAFQSCDDNKTYAEMLEDEKDAIDGYISRNDIKVISIDELLSRKDTMTAPNEYVLFKDNGVYMNIVDRGAKDENGYTIKPENNDQVTVRCIEYDLIEQDTIYNNSNWFTANGLEVFNYIKSGTYSYGQFTEGSLATNIYGFDYSTAVPSGWLLPLEYVGHKAHVKLIVPSKMGHTYAQKYVYPYAYELIYRIWE